MLDHPELPWSDIFDYLATVGSARSFSDLCYLVLANISLLIRFDVNGIFSLIDESGKVTCREFVGEAGKWVQSFNRYYWKTAPADSLNVDKTGVMDWTRFQNSEYVTDFLNPQGIRYSTWTLLGKVDGFYASFVINRSRDAQAFDHQEIAILQAIQPHLVNYFGMINSWNWQSENYPEVEELLSEYQSLTRREAEVAALLCRRFSTKMICSCCLITPKTAYKHIENIFMKVNVNSRDELAVKLKRLSK